MLSNAEVARRFARGHTSGSSQHVFIDGDRIYSYGRHFCIARRVNGVVLLTTRTYSNSTAKHVRHVWSALAGSESEIVRCYDPGATSEANMKHYDEEIAELEEKVRRARINKAVWQSVLEKTQEHRQKYMGAMGVNDFDKYKQEFDN